MTTEPSAGLKSGVARAERLNMMWGHSLAWTRIGPDVAVASCTQCGKDLDVLVEDGAAVLSGELLDNFCSNRG